MAKHFTVAVIEAGGFYEIENSNLTQVPANDVYYVRALSIAMFKHMAVMLIQGQLGKDPLWNNPLIDWQQFTEPQTGLNDESVLFSQGHTLGGGSARNFMW